MPAFDAGTIDKGSDGRDNRPHAEGGHEGAIRLCPELTEKKAKLAANMRPKGRMKTAPAENTFATLCE